MEGRVNLLQSQLIAIALAPVVDLTREEDEGGVGGSMVLGSSFRMSPLSNWTRRLQTLWRHWEGTGSS